MKKRIASASAYLLLALGAGYGGSYLYRALNPEPVALADTAIPAWRTSLPPGTGGPAGAVDFVAASNAAIPSVVYITSTSVQQANTLDMFFFGTPNSQQVSSGSGVIFSANGYVVTNNHVIDQAETIEVVHQRKTYTAKVVGTDPSTDLALLKIDGQGFPAIRVADSRKISVGEWVLAVGNPFNLTSTVTAGIISAKGRNINLLNSQFPIESFIQTDAAINPGNSGGALVNTKGELVGINTAIFSKTGSYTGYGFAVPSDIVKKVVEDLIQYGTVQKAFFGADVTEVDSKVAKNLDLPDYKGVAITALSDDGAAKEAGLKVNDVILKINGQAITGKGVYDEELSYYNPGDKVTIQYRRGRELATTTARLTNREGTTELLRRSIFSSKTVGADMEPLSKVERDRYKLEGGIRITKAYANGLIRRLGLEEGYVITAINQEPCREPRDVERLLAQAQNRGRVVIEGVDRNGRPGYYSFGY